ncbi:PTS sugar transporter subunit IIB [Trichococcus flocculiformis]|uniref:PTS sugar transporter subunit IIB n=1 Tax=Trichococcus flocculiformis TaxID=82803 RepID=UPI003DA5874D
MIKLMRVDHRLLHGQVAFTWTQSLGVDSILIANDDVMKDEIRKTTIKLAKPQGVKLVIKSIEDSIKALQSGVTDNYKLFIIVETIKDAVALASAYPEIKQINLGGTKPIKEGKQISKTICATKEDLDSLKKLSTSGVKIEIRQIPSDTPINPFT